jgi:parallel beta-helix repeat protein
MRDGRLWFFAVIVALVSDASAAEIADGCATPKAANSRRAFYVDPAKGSMSNDGSAARPWSTLAEVFEKKLVAAPSAPVKPGDTIFLNTGDHGNVQIAGANDEFVTIQAAPGQTPTLRALRVNSASKWILTGLKIQGAGDGSSNSRPGPALIELGRNQSFGPTSDIIFSANSVSTTDNPSAWTDEDWIKKPFNFGLLSSGTCVSVIGNHFFNLRNAVQFDGERHLIAENKIDNFSADGIDVIASNATIRNNRITDGRHRKSDPLHPDGIQGWTKGGATNTNVVIDGNIVIKTGDPRISDMQGICIFDGQWDGLTISNNVVVTNHWHGITVFGASNAKIINNTVVPHDPGRSTWITVQNAKGGRPSENVIVRNNITARLDRHGGGIVADHNLMASMIVTSDPGKPVYISKPGRYDNNNIIDPNIYNTLVMVDRSNGTYDLRLKTNSPAIGAGNPDSAPRTDILGKKRTAPIDIGAYAASR